MIDEGIDLASYNLDLYDSAIGSEYGMADQLILTGKQTFEKIPEFLALSDFCLLPAHMDEHIMQDIVPIKIYENLLMKKVVIASELPGLSEEFAYGNGIEYIREASEVLETVHKILDDDINDEIAANAREYVKSNDWEVITDKFEEAMKKLL